MCELTAAVALIEDIGRRPIGDDFDSLSAELLLLRRACDLLELRFARTAAALRATPQFAEGDDGSLLCWIRHECRMSGYAASSSLAVGQEATALPESTGAMERGEIGFGHLTHLARLSGALRESAESRGIDIPPDAALVEEGPLVAKARRQTVNRFRHECAHVRHALDVETVLAEQRDLAEARSLEIASRDDGCLSLTGFLDPVGAATLRTALEPLSRRSGPDDHRSAARRNADALIEFIEHGMSDAAPSGRGAWAPHLQVTASVETLIGASGAPGGELELGGMIAGETVRRLACDATVSRIVFGPDSVVCDVGRSVRVPAPATRRALRARDGGCVWPGCLRSASFTSAHHVVHWGDGGATDLSNLVLLCSRHHWMVHEGGWQLIRAADGEVTVTPPYRAPSRGGFRERSPTAA
jgi:hypothetical protein